MPTLAVTIALIAVIAAVLFIIVVVRLWRLAFPSDTGTTVRVAATAATLAIWSGTLSAAFAAGYKIFAQLFLFPFLIDGDRVVQSIHHGESIFRALNTLIPDANSLLIILSEIPFFRVLLAYATLVLLTRLFSVVEAAQLPKWIAPLQRVERYLWLNLLVVTIFFLGIYLSIASLCTIPALQINQPFTDSEKTQISTQLDPPSDDSFSKAFPESLDMPTDQLAHLRQQLAEAAGEPLQKVDRDCHTAEQSAASTLSSPSAPRSAAGSPDTTKAPKDPLVLVLMNNPETLSQVRELINLYDTDRCNRIHIYQGLRTTVQQQEKSLSDSAKSQLQSNFAVRLTGRDRADYIYGLEADFKSNVGQLQNTLSGCRYAAQGDDPTVSLKAEFVDEMLRSSIPGGTLPPNNLILIPSNYTSTPVSCQLDQSSLLTRSVAPAPRLGIFSFFFGWLEDSDSLALAVICGMLGVGLVGCIVSTFVRQTAIRGPKSAFIPDIFPVIVRGFTAAIVVYLAIQGGLNVFSSTLNQANPYVLLCACLVGAVFSEDVWVAARNRLQSAESTRNGSGSPVPVPAAKSDAARTQIQLKAPPVQSNPNEDPTKKQE